MSIKKKSAVNAVKPKKRKVSVRTSPPKQWDQKDLNEMSRIVLGAPNPVEGQKLAAEHFGTSYAAIQCRWSRYQRGINMERVKRKNKVGSITIKQSKSYNIPTKPVYKVPNEVVDTINRDILDIIDIRSMKINKTDRTITIHF